jgi:hypothetical protein
VVQSVTPAGTAAASVGGTAPAGFASGQHTLRLVPVYWSTPDSATQSSLQTLADQTAQYWNSQANGRFSVTTGGGRARRPAASGLPGCPSG